MVEKIFTPKMIAWLFIVAMVQYVCFEWAHLGDWWHCNETTFIRFSKMAGKDANYTYGELLSESDNYLLMLVALIPVGIYLKNIPIIPYLITLLFDFIFVATIFCFKANPYMTNWNKIYWAGFSVGLFILKVWWYNFKRTEVKDEYPVRYKN